MAQGSWTAPGGREFPSTCWTRFRKVAGTDEEGRRAALEELARAYWPPIHAYLRARWGKTDDQARELTQEFFLWMLEEEFFRKADPLRGSFRGFVKTALSNFVLNDLEARSRLKRGGGHRILPLGELPGGMEGVEPPDLRTMTPEEILDDAWRTGLLVRAERLLEERLREEGRDLAYRIFREYYVVGPDGTAYRDLAMRHGVPESEVLNHLRLGRKRFRAVLSDLVAETVSDPAELAGEIRALFGEEGPA